MKDNQAITHLAMPERSIPVLLGCDERKADGWLSESPATLGFITSVRAIGQTDLLQALDPKRVKSFLRKFGPVHHSEYNRLLYVLDLANATFSGNRRAIAKATEALEGTRWVVRDLLAVPPTEPLRLLQQNLNAILRRTRFVVWCYNANGVLATGIYCEDVATALYVLALSRMGTLGGIGVCLRCRNTFIRKRVDQHFCSHRCRSAFNMRKGREKQKQRSRAKDKRGRRTGRTVKSKPKKNQGR